MTRLAVIKVWVSLCIITGCNGNASIERETVKTPDALRIEKAKEASASDPMSNKGIGPVKDIKLDADINSTMAKEGEELYQQFCTACHKIDKQYIGPPPKDILNRRTPEWVMNMILNPEEMVKKDPDARRLLEEANGAMMANQNLTDEQARKILEYFRTL